MAQISAALVNQRFPAISGRSLAGNEVKFPDDLSGKVTLVVVAMERSAQPMVDSWISPFRDAFAGLEGYAWYEVPVIDRKIGFFLSGMIDAGMRAGIPPAVHGSVVTVYGSARTIMDALGIADHSTASAFLLDQQGIVRLRGEGYAGEEAIRAMLAAARRLAGE
ncbi:hypothetical protein [Methanofollis tationis]|uniref:Redoxin domain-containing protein n=1 Tax=Methanofollis tationis TaxID=81417 RepID=A0A7K4HKV5_9EURY|nr:hypothetical protein [Methanofollis tationis]NVO65905.1 hypothetical protein [Methanofollis tationis]